jgi:hypothetical protein
MSALAAFAVVVVAFVTGARVMIVAVVPVPGIVMVTEGHALRRHHGGYALERQQDRHGDDEQPD